jgi:hypothetical protein
MSTCRDAPGRVSEAAACLLSQGASLKSWLFFLLAVLLSRWNDVFDRCILPQVAS